MTLYHLIQRPFFGTTLYPINRLRHVDRDIFDKQRAKYKGKEAICNGGIEAFDCLWNEVIHLSPIHPKDIFAALEDAGQQRSQKRHPYFFAFDAAALDPFHTIFFHTQNGKEENYNTEKVEQYRAVPEETKKYFREAITRRERPSLWNFTIHVLYHGTIDVKDVPIIDKHGVILEERTRIFEAKV